MNSTAPIRSRAPEEGSFQIPLWGVPLILVLLYVCLFSGLGALGLVGPDEPRYAAIARGMAETHDWITPRLWGTPWFEKPVLYYWTAGAAMRILGVSEFAARLPSALAALLAVIAVAWTALRSYGAGAAWYSLLMLPTSVAMIGFSRAASPDMLFAGLLTAAMAVASEMLQKPRPGPILRVAFGFFLGAAVLAKGPAAVILAGGATLLWAALSRQWHASFRFLHPLILVVFCATALPWYILCALRNPYFLRVFIWQHNFERYLTPVFEHRQPFWFFGPIFLLGILPWLPLLVSGLYDAFRNLHIEAVRDSPALFLSSWALFTVSFFSLSQSKLPGYILPAIPPAILLLAGSSARQTAQNAKGIRLAFVCTGLFFPLLAGIAIVKLPVILDITFSPGQNPVPGLRAGLAAALAGGALGLGFAAYRKWNGAVCILAGTTVILLLIATHVVLPNLDESVSVRPVALGIIGSYSPKLDKIAVLHLPRDFEYGLDYYFQTALPEWTPERKEVTLIFSGKQGLEQLALLPQFNHMTQNKLFMPLDPSGRVFLVDLTLEESPGN